MQLREAKITDDVLHVTSILGRDLPAKHINTKVSAKIFGLSIEVPQYSCRQEDLLDALAVRPSGILTKLKQNQRIRTRSISIPLESFQRGSETQAELMERHYLNSVRLGTKALTETAKSCKVPLDELGFLCCVTSTGFLMPSLSAYIAKELQLSCDLQRSDIVGMGCSAGVNGLSALAGWTTMNPERPGALICVEVASAMYSADPSRETLVVNSLFGDGAVALLAVNAEGALARRIAGLRVLSLMAHLMLEDIDGVRFDWDREPGR
jgi:polyketide synthase Type III